MKFPVAHCHPSQSCPFWGCHRHMVMSVQLTQIVSSSQVAGPQSPASGEEHLAHSACSQPVTTCQLLLTKQLKKVLRWPEVYFHGKPTFPHFSSTKSLLEKLA